MTVVLAGRLLGKKFFWLQAFSNPPIPGFFTRLLLNQSDEILVQSRVQASNLKSLGVEKPRIKLIRS